MKFLPVSRRCLIAAWMVSGGTVLADPTYPPQISAAPRQPVQRQISYGKMAPHEYHDRAVLLARAGRLKEGLELLNRMRYWYPDDLSVQRDYIVVSGWALHDQDAVETYTTMPHHEADPDYVLLSVASSFRRLHYYHRALELFHLGAQRFPQNLAFISGESLTLTDMKQPANALNLAQRSINTHPFSVDLLLAAGYAEMALYQPVDALRYYDRAIRLDPANREANRSRIYAIEEMGAPEVALRLADRHRGLVTVEDRRRLQGSEAAQLVRFGQVEAVSDDQRFAMTDRAIAKLDGLIAEWTAENATNDVLRGRFDRMIAYRDRIRMHDVIREYHLMRADHIEIPTYVLEAVADAFLYLKEPEHSRRLYEQVLRADPKFFEAKIGLFYSLIETEHFEEAISLIDKTDQEQAKWIYLKGSPAPLPNPARETADTTSAQARLLADDLKGAQQRFTALASAAPANPSFVGGLANVYEARGWHRRAKEEYELASALASHDISLQIGTGENDLALRNYTQALRQSAMLTQKYPERDDVKHFARDVDLYQRAELHIAIDETLESNPGSVTGGNTLTFNTQLFTPMLFDHWRIFASDLIAHQREPDGEGNITLRAPGAGVEYRGPSVVATAELYNGTFGRIVGGRSSNLGAQVTGTIDLSDKWSIGGTGAIFAREAPLRALRHGITANEGNISATYRASESQQVVVAADYMPFSDGNNRTSLSTTYEQRIYTSPRIKVDAIGSLGTDHNTSSNRPYFNPKLDVAASVGAQASQILYQRYEFQWDHQLTASVGPYWEQAYGTSAAYDIRYEHRLHTSDAFSVGAGVGYHRQAYDGQNQSAVDLLLDLTWKF